MSDSREHAGSRASETKGTASVCARVLVHPECSQEVLALADYIGSTSGIIQFAKESPDREFIIGTESGVQYALQQARRDAVFFFPETEPVCTDMKRITLDKIIEVMKHGGK